MKTPTRRIIIISLLLILFSYSIVTAHDNCENISDLLVNPECEYLYLSYILRTAPPIKHHLDQCKGVWNGIHVEQDFLSNPVFYIDGQVLIYYNMVNYKKRIMANDKRALCTLVLVQDSFVLLNSNHEYYSIHPKLYMDYPPKDNIKRNYYRTFVKSLFFRHLWLTASYDVLPRFDDLFVAGTPLVSWTDDILSDVLFFPKTMDIALAHSDKKLQKEMLPLILQRFQQSMNSQEELESSLIAWFHLGFQNSPDSVNYLLTGDYNADFDAVEMAFISACTNNTPDLFAKIIGIIMEHPKANVEQVRWKLVFRYSDVILKRSLHERALEYFDIYLKSLPFELNDDEIFHVKFLNLHYQQTALHHDFISKMI